jgi:hypothetical protein
LEKFFPHFEVVDFDLKSYLFKELILKEQEFRSRLKEIDWSLFSQKVVAVYCSTDAIIPVWAYMLVASNAQPFSNEVFFGTPSAYYSAYFSKIIENIDGKEFLDQKVVIKGCSGVPVPPSAYMDITKKLRPYVYSIMYGEPCSTVPIYKRPVKKHQ